MKKILLFTTMFFMFSLCICGKELEEKVINNIGGESMELLGDVLFLPNENNYVMFLMTGSKELEGLKTNDGTSIIVADVAIIKFDQNGNILSKNLWGGTGSDYLVNSNFNKSGEIILYGYSNSKDLEDFEITNGFDSVIYKYDKDGNLLLKKTWGGNKDDKFSYLTLLDDGSFIGVGESSSTDLEGLQNKGKADAFIVKFDKDGNVLWQKNWGGNNADLFSDVVVSSDGGIILSGQTYSNNIENFTYKGGYDVMVVKYDKDGNMLWQKGFGGTSNEMGANIEGFDDGFVFVFNYSGEIEEFSNFSSTTDVGIIKYDYDGKELWKKNYSGNKEDYIFNVVSDKKNNFYLLGRSSSSDLGFLPVDDSDDALIVKYDKSGNKIDQRIFGGSSFDYFFRMLFIDDEFFAFLTSSSKNIGNYENNGSYDIFTLKYSYRYDMNIVDNDNGAIETVVDGDFGKISIKPNDGYEINKIIVKDSTGKELEIFKLDEVNYSFKLNDDVTIEVLFKEKVIIENPKTGSGAYLGVLFGMLFISIISLFSIMNKRDSFEL